MIYCGIDPGLKGAIAFVDQGKLTLYPMPLNPKGIDTFTVIMLLNNWKPDRLVLEDQFAHRYGKMSKESILTMGQNWGRIVGAAEALRIQTHIVLPNVWQAALAPKKLYPMDDSKARSFAACAKFFPGYDFKKHDGKADAALLAKYGELYANSMTVSK